MSSVPLPAPRSSKASAARLAKSRAMARVCFIAGALLLPLVLGIFWLKSGHLDRLAIAIAIGVSTLVETFGAFQLVLSGGLLGRGGGKGGNVVRRPLQIEFCRRAIGRLGDGKEPLLTLLRERAHTPLVKECLNRCQDCNLGMLVATADGIPVIVKDAEQLLSDVDELAATEA